MDYQLQIYGSPRSPRSKKDRMTTSNQPNFSTSPLRFNNPKSETKVIPKPRDSYFGNDFSSKKSLDMCCFPSPSLRTKNKKQILKKPINQIQIKSPLTDFLYNAMDWSQKNCVGVVLDTKVVLVHSPFEKTQKFRCNSSDAISIRFSPDGNQLSLGSLLGSIRIFDIERESPIQSFLTNKTSVLTIDQNGFLVVSGHANGCISLNDTRSLGVQELKFHSLCCCKVLFSKSNTNLFASGSGDSIAAVWDLRNLDQPYTTYKNHKSTVKAICWSKKTDNIVTGGGIEDFTINSWNFNTGQTIKSVCVGSQICNLFYSQNEEELVSTEGYSDFRMNIWDAKELKIAATIDSHHDRILYAAMSPDQEQICTVTNQDPLQFWKLFSNNKKVLIR